jgi:hypothetical protein
MGMRPGDATEVATRTPAGAIPQGAYGVGVPASAGFLASMTGAPAADPAPGMAIVTSARAGAIGLAGAALLLFYYQRRLLK